MVLKKLILCADDFGQNQAITQGILELAQMGRLSAVSCMVNGEYWPDELHRLKECAVDIGLHLNLTHGKSFSKGLVPLLVAELGLKKIDKIQLYQEIEDQILKFKQDIGRFPDFIDGHQHVHQLHIIAPTLLEVVHKLDFKPWFRTTYTAHNMRGFSRMHWKSWSLYYLGGASFAKLLLNKGMQSNADFSGDYRFHAGVNYAKNFRIFLKKIPQGGLIMCHPGHFSSDEHDRIAAIRPIEWQYFASSHFLKDLKQFGFQLARFDALENTRQADIQ